MKKEEKINILFVLPNFDTGGSEKLAFDIIEHIDKEKFAPVLCVFFSGKLELRRVRFFYKGESLDEIIKIDLFGEEFRFKPDEQVKDTDKVVQFLKTHIEEAGKLFQYKSSGKNKMAILLLAAMNLSKEYHELKDNYSELENSVANRISSMVEKIDKSI